MTGRPTGRARSPPDSRCGSSPRKAASGRPRRNLGARAAEGDILFFIDSDVMLRPDSIDRLVRRFADGDVDAVCGVQAADMRHRDLASQYKNLWIRWTYLRLDRRGAALLYDRGGHPPRRCSGKPAASTTVTRLPAWRTRRSARSWRAWASACGSSPTSRSST